MSCYWFAKDHPRYVRHRHTDECADPEQCSGCQPCTEDHCTRCGREHSAHVCPSCLADVRADLTEIRRLCGDLLTEAARRGVDSEAMNLLGPVPHPEARGHAEASYRAGRLPEGWLETGAHGDDCPLLRNEACTGCKSANLHPLTVAWWWNECYREALGHPDTPALRPPISAGRTYDPGFGIRGLLRYLDTHLDRCATTDDVPFADFARDLQHCRAHLERVLHDGEQVELGAPCMKCGTRVQRSTADNGTVTFSCPRCRETVSEQGYRLAVKSEYIEKADTLSADDMAIRTGVPAGTIRRWANTRRVDGVDHDPLFRACARNGQGRKVYRVADVERIRDCGGDRRGTKTVKRCGATVSNEGAA